MIRIYPVNPPTWAWGVLLSEAVHHARPLTSAPIEPVFRRARRPQATEPQQVIRRADQIAGRLRARDAADPALAQAADRLHPAEDLFHLLAQPLAQAITRVPRGPAVQARGAPAADAGEVGPNPAPPQAPDEISAVRALGRAHRRGVSAVIQ
jgi:hypothetical protein